MRARRSSGEVFSARRRCRRQRRARRPRPTHERPPVPDDRLLGSGFSTEFDGAKPRIFTHIPASAAYADLPTSRSPVSWCMRSREAGLDERPNLHSAVQGHGDAIGSRPKSGARNTMRVGAPDASSAQRMSRMRRRSTNYRGCSRCRNHNLSIRVFQRDDAPRR